MQRLTLTAAVAALMCLTGCYPPNGSADSGTTPGVTGEPLTLEMWYVPAGPGTVTLYTRLNGGDWGASVPQYLDGWYGVGFQPVYAGSTVEYYWLVDQDPNRSDDDRTSCWAWAALGVMANTYEGMDLQPVAVPNGGTGCNFLVTMNASPSM